MRRLIVIGMCIALGVLVSSCQSGGGVSIPGAVSLSFSKKVQRDHWPLQWQQNHKIEAKFPKIPPAYDERFEIGADFLANKVAINAATIEVIKKTHLHSFGTNGSQATSHFDIQPEADNYRIIVKEKSQGLDEETSLIVDQKMRLLEYLSRRVRKVGDTYETSFVRAKWDKNERGNPIYRINSGGRDRELRSDELLVPEDVLFLLPIFAPNTGFEADFKILSVPFVGIYRCLYTVRPDAEESGEKLVELTPRSPLGEEHSFIVDKDNAIVEGRTASGIYLHPMSLTASSGLDAFFRLRQRERDSLVFNGTWLFSKYASDGGRVAIAAESEAPPAKSWLKLNTSYLGLMVSPAASTEFDSIANFTDRESIRLYNTAIQAKDSEAAANARSLERAKAMRLKVKLDYFAGKGKHHNYADIIAARALQDGDVSQVRQESLRVDGKPAKRIEFVTRRIRRVGRRSVRGQEILRSILIVDAGTTVVTLDLTVGHGWRELTGGIRALHRSLKISAPQAKGTKR